MPKYSLHTHTTLIKKKTTSKCSHLVENDKKWYKFDIFDYLVIVLSLCLSVISIFFSQTSDTLNCSITLFIYFRIIYKQGNSFITVLCCISWCLLCNLLLGVSFYSYFFRIDLKRKCVFVCVCFAITIYH